MEAQKLKINKGDKVDQKNNNCAIYWHDVRLWKMHVNMRYTQ